MERKTRLFLLFAITTLAALAVLALLPSASAYTVELYLDNEQASDAIWLDTPASLNGVWIWEGNNGTTNQDYWKFNASEGQHIEIKWCKYNNYGQPEAPFRGATYYMKYEVWDPAYRPIHEYHLTYRQGGGDEYWRDTFGFVVPKNLGGRYFIRVWVDPPQNEKRDFAYYFLNVTVEDPKDLTTADHQDGMMEMSDTWFVDYNWEDYYTVSLDAGDLMTIALGRGVASQPFYLEVWEEIPFGSASERSHMLNRTQAGATTLVQVRFAVTHDGVYVVRVWRTFDAANNQIERSSYSIDCYYDTATLDGNEQPDQGPMVIKTATIRNVPIEMGYDVHDWYRVQLLAGDKLFRVHVDFDDYQVDLGHAYELVIYNGSGFLMWTDSSRDTGPSFADSLELPPSSTTTIFDQDEVFYVRVSVNTVDCYWGFSGFKTRYDITFTLSNRAPVLVVPFEDKYEWDEDNKMSIELNSHFSDPDGDKMSYTVYNKTADWTIDVPSLAYNGYLNITSPKDWSGEVWWRLRAVDSGQTDERHYIYIDLHLIVRPVSDPPRSTGPISLACDEEASASTNLSKTFSDPDDGPQGVLTFGHTMTDQLDIVITLNSVTGAMLLVPEPDVFGVFTFEVWCQDTDHKLTETLTLTVRQINDVPRIVAPIPKVEMEEADDPVELDLAGYFKDVDGEQLIYSWTIPTSVSDSLNVYHKNNVNTESHIIIELLKDTFYGRVVLNITCKDEANTFVKQDLVIEVTNVPNRPSIAYTPSGNPSDIDEGQSLTFRVTDVLDADLPETGLHTYTWWVDEDLLLDFNESVYVFTTDYDSAGAHSVKVVVNDPTGLEADQKPVWNFHVRNVNRAPTATITTVASDITNKDTIVLTVDTSDPDGDPVEIVWYLIGELDDKALGTGSPLEVKLPAGTQKVEVEVKDSNGAVAKDSFNIKVTAVEEEGASYMMFGIIALVIVIVVVALLVAMKMRGRPKVVRPEATIDVESLQKEYDPSQGRGGYDPTPKDNEGYQRLR